MEIQWVTDKNGNDFYPVTHQKAVIVDGSKTLDKKLSEMESDISNKANPSSIPTNVSQLTNDSNYQTEAQVKSTVSNEVAKIVADAPENYDTLKEISDWISGHENDASAMNSAIKDNKSAITTLQTDKAEKTEIPTELPANGGNADTVGGHTVKSDVPENAVFTDTVYDDAEVKEIISKQYTEMMDIKMLGWSVPRECPIQNEVAGNQFVQKVGRVDLGSLAWGYDATSGHERLRSVALSSIKPPKSSAVLANIYTNGYILNSANGTFLHANDKAISVDPDGIIWVYDSSYTDATTFKEAMKGQYLYYELAAPVTITIDGNEIGEAVSDVRKEITVNLLNSTLETDTLNGVTFTNNGDGTYTLTGTATATVFAQLGRCSFEKNKTYKLLGWGNTRYLRDAIGLYIQTEIGNVFDENGKGGFYTPASDTSCSVIVVILNNTTITNAIIKPMITTNLSATYDDFVPYTGDSGSLNGDVAEIRANFDNLVELGEDITD